VDKVQQLAKQFHHGTGAFFLFDQSLIAFIELSEHNDSKKLKKLALAYNKFVPKLLCQSVCRNV